MKKVTVDEFLNLVKTDKALHDSFKAALQEAKGKGAAEAAKALGYEIEKPELQALDDDLLTSVAGGVNVRDNNNFDLNNLFPSGLGGDFNYNSLQNLLNSSVSAHAADFHASNIFK